MTPFVAAKSTQVKVEIALFKFDDKLLNQWIFCRRASKFIVAYNEVMESLKVNHSHGMCFEMLSDGGREDYDIVLQTLVRLAEIRISYS